MTVAHPLAARLRELLAQPDTKDECLAFFDGMAEPDRRALAPIAITALRDVSGNLSVQVDKNTWQRNPLIDVATVAVHATATASEIHKLGRTANLLTDDDAFHILEDRRPDWIRTLVDDRLDQRGPSAWHLTRRLIRAGLCDKPATEQYYTAMISGIAARGDRERRAYDALLDDPDLLDDEVWKLFEYEGAGDNTLANIDRFSRLEWNDSLVRLATEGRLDRNRLLDASLAALELGFNHYRAKWFLALFDALAPTSDELVSRRAVLLGLLANPAPNVATGVLVHVSAMYKRGEIVSDMVLVEALRPLLLAKAKGTVKQALTILAKTVNVEPLLATAVAETATVALAHEAPDAQEAAWKLIGPLTPPPPQLRDLVERVRPVVAATLVPAIDAWLGEPDADHANESGPQSRPTPNASIGFDVSTLAEFSAAELERVQIPALLAGVEQGRFTLPAMVFDGTDIRRLDPADAVAPIENLDALVATCARVLEDETAVDDFELALDGIARLGQERPVDFEARTSPVRKRLAQFAAKIDARHTYVGDLAIEIAGPLDAWLTNTEPTVVRGKVGYIQTFLHQRTFNVAQRVARGMTQPLLSAPTHRGGWIDPPTFVARLQDIDGEPDAFDLNLALLRLAPERRVEALAGLGDGADEWIQASRYALGGDAVPGKNVALWITASRARSPRHIDDTLPKRFHGHGPDTLAPAVFHLEHDDRAIGSTHSHHYYFVSTTEPLAATAHPQMPTQLLHPPRERWPYRGPQWASGPGGVIALATVWPSARESFFALGLENLVWNIDWDMAAWDNIEYLRPLLDPNTPLLPVALQLLAVGLAAKEPGERGLATDIAINAIDDGRLGTDNLGAVLRGFQSEPIIKPPRWASQLTDVAAVSELHAHVVLSALVYAFADAPEPLPRGYGKLIELALQLAAGLGVGVVDPDAVAFLSALTGSSISAKAARALVALPSDTARVDLVPAAIGQRISRLREWNRPD